MDKKIARWEARGLGNGETRYALRTAPKGRGIELGAYSSWDNPRAEEASEPIARRIEEEARAQGYHLGVESWNDLAD